MKISSLDGVIAPTEQTLIPVSDEGLLRGDGAFEVLRLYGGKPFAAEDHYMRLQRSCDGLKLPVDLERFTAEVTALLQRNGAVDALLRLVVTRGGRRIASIEPMPALLETIRVATITHAPGTLLSGLKTLSYAANMLAGRMARERGFDEALFVTPEGRVLEGPTWSFFWVESGKLFTPPLEDHILSSITRARVLDEVDVTERSCLLTELARAEEAFLASTVREVTPIAVIDDLILPITPGPVTVTARARLRERIARELSVTAELTSG